MPGRRTRMHRSAPACSFLLAVVALSGCASRGPQASTPPTVPSGTATGTRETPAKPASSDQPGAPATERSRTPTAPEKDDKTAAEASRQTSTASSATSGLTGCLSKGDTADEYVLTDASGKRTSVSGVADLAKHVGHRVRLTGDASGSDTFKVTEIQHLAPSCAAKP